MRLAASTSVRETASTFYYLSTILYYLSYFPEAVSTLSQYFKETNLLPTKTMVKIAFEISPSTFSIAVKLRQLLISFILSRN